MSASRAAANTFCPSLFRTVESQNAFEDVSHKVLHFHADHCVIPRCVPVLFKERRLTRSSCLKAF